MANGDPKEFRKTIDAEAKRAGLNDEQIKLLYILNGIESKSGTASEKSYKNTTAARIRKVFGSGSRIAKLSDEEINELKKDDEAFFNFVYKGRIGNTDEGDGYKYRGRGGVQLTGRSNYENITKILNKNGIDIDLVANPELAADPRYSASILIAFSEHRGMFDPNHKRYISPEDIEAIKNGDIEAIDKLHEITNPGAPNERLQKQAAIVYENTDGEYDISDGSEGNEILTNLGRTDTKTAPPLQYKVQIGVWKGHTVPAEKQKLINSLREDEGYTVIKEHLRGKLYKYSVYKTDDGILTGKQSADKLTEELVGLGFPNSFVYAEKDGVRIEMEEAKKIEKEKEKSPYNMPPTETNPTPEMLEASPKYSSAEEIKKDYDNGVIKSGDIVNLDGYHYQIEESDGTGLITPYRESDNTFNGGEGGTLSIDDYIDRIKEDEKLQKEVREEENRKKKEKERKEELSGGDIYGVVTDTETGAIIPNAKVTITDQDGNTQVVIADENGFYTVEKVDTNKNYTISIKNDAGEELYKTEVNSEDFVDGNVIRDLNVEDVVEEEVEDVVELKTSTLSTEEQDILDNYSIDGTVGEGKAEIKDSSGKTIAYLEGNKLIGKKTIPIIGEQTFEIGEYVDNGDGTYTFKEGKDYNTVMSAASSEEKKVIETFRKAAEDNPQFAQDIINTTEGNDTNMSGDDLKTSATTFTPSSEEEEVVVEEIIEEKPTTTEVEVYNPNTEKTETITVPIDDNGAVTEYPENVEYDEDNDRYVYKSTEIDYENIEYQDVHYLDDESTVKAKILNNNPEHANDPDKLEELYKEELESQEWTREEIEELTERQQYIDQIFAENPELAEKYKDIPIEDYQITDGFYEEIYDRMYELEEEDFEVQRRANKVETGVFETNQEREDRERDSIRVNELNERKNNNTITSEEQTELSEIISNYGGWDPNELYEENKTNQSERDANIEAGKGDFTNSEIQDQEYEEEELDYEREDNFKITGIKETNSEKSDRIESEKIANEEKGLGRITDVQAEDQNVIWSTPDSEKKLRNDLKDSLNTQESQIRAAAGDDEKIAELEEQAETTRLALEYLELKNKHGRKDDVFDIKTFKEALENNDTQQLSMFYNDQRTEAIGKLEKDRQSIEDGTFEGSEEERDKILTTLETLKESKQKSELPTEYTDRFGEIKGTERLKWDKKGKAYVGHGDITGDSRTSRELVYLTNIDADDKQISQLNALLKDREYIEEGNKNNLAVIANAQNDLANSGITTVEPVGGLSGSGFARVIDWNTGTSYYVDSDWLYADVGTRAINLEKKEKKGSITLEEAEELKGLRQNAPYLRIQGQVNKTAGLLSNVKSGTHGHPKGVHSRYNSIKEVDEFILSRKKQIFKTGANPDVNLSAEQIALFDEINDPDFDNSLLEQKLNEIVSYSPEAFEYDLTKEPETTNEETRSQGPTGQDILQGTIDVATGIMDSFGGPDALINAVMGKKALAAAMKDVTPMQQAKLSPMFHEHLRETKELSKRGYHPSEELKIRRGIDTAYQQGLENTVRGTAGDRAKFLAASGIFDAKRSLALLEVSAQDAALQRENKKAYTELLTYKENFDAAQQEAKRTENLQMQLANKKAASEFAGLTFANALSGMGGNSSLIDQLKGMMMNNYTKNNGFKLTSEYEENPPTNETEE